MLNFVFKHKEMFNQAMQSNSHAIMLESEDTVLTQNLAKIMAMNFCCLQDEKPCLMCSKCLKIISNNSVDTFVYPKKNTMLMDDVKDIMENINVIPLENEYKVFILNNFDESSTIVQNKMLKTLEEPPKFVKFVLTVKNRLKVLPTIASRCQVLTLPKFSVNDINELLTALPQEQREIISETSNGSLLAMENLKNKNDYFELYNIALDLLQNLTNSKQILKFSSKLVEKKNSLFEILNLLELFLFDIIKINSRKEDFVQNKYCINNLKKISKEYNIKTCVDLQERIRILKEKLQFNVNFNLVIDEFLIGILEDKWKNK